MPSFDVVSEVDMHEVSNAIDQANREVSTRFDFKGTDANYELKDSVVTMHADVEFQLKQMLDILYNKFTRRNIDLGCLDIAGPQISGKKAHQTVTIQQGIETLLAKKIVKMIKDAKLKTQAAVQGEKVRVTGKKRDGLQQIIQMLREAELGIPLQYVNFRD